MARIPDVEKILEAIDNDHLGDQWKNKVRPWLEDAWNYGYTTGRADALADEGYPKGQQP